MEKLIGGRYQIVTTLSSGGFGKTYLAEDKHQFNRRCVVKKLQPLSANPKTWSIATQLFQREAQIQHRLGHHPQIPRLFAYFQEQQQFYLVQELIEGHALSEELPPGKQLSESEVIALLQDILEPLVFVHQQQVIHRDLKPPNLIRRHKDGKIVLIDFGSVKELAATKVLNPQGETQIVTTIGTPGYMPSEQSTGKARLSSDVYAVGIIGIQALTGKMPQELKEDPETAEIIWPEHTTVSPKLAFVLDKMVRYDFRERYRSAQSALEALQQLNQQKSSSFSLAQSSHVPLHSSKKVPPPKVGSTGRSTVTRGAEIATVFILTGLGGWYAYQGLTKYLTLRTIQESIQTGNYSQCIQLAQMVNKHSAISTQLESLSQNCQNLQAKGYLTKAQQLVREQKYAQARRELKQIASYTSSYSSAQVLLEQLNPANYQFYAYYQQARDYIERSDYAPAWESLYLAAEQAMIEGQPTLLWAEILKQEQGLFQSVAQQEAQQWQLLKNILFKAEPDDYQITYQRAKLQLDGDHNHHHTREFELLFAAARIAIEHQQSESMLAQLQQDRLDRFKNLAIGHSEWLNLIKALEQNNPQLLGKK